MDKQYKVSACLLVKDEGRYLPEWLEWHLGIGVEHFYIYNNGSEIPVSQSVPAELADKVTMVDFPPPRESTQREAYRSSAGTIPGQRFYQRAQEQVEMVAQEAVNEIAQALTDYLEG